MLTKDLQRVEIDVDNDSLSFFEANSEKSSNLGQPQGATRVFLISNENYSVFQDIVKKDTTAQLDEQLLNFNFLGRVSEEMKDEVDLVIPVKALRMEKNR
ncbi:unnamed protein product [Clavelina lepadiformis]|uniref:Uncharacterized protein n=1 Tax=Clavelina lepadiformis TaxID=159417 RepID=A0ABP0G845_CLALP